MDKLLEIITDLDAQKHKLENEDFLCLIIRSDLGPIRTFGLARYYYMFSVPYNGGTRLGIAYGMFQDESIKSNPNVQKFINDMYGKREYADNTESHVYEKLLQDPCCLLLKEELNRRQIMFLDQTYEILSLGDRKAIACVIHNQKNETHIEPKIVSQFEEIYEVK